MCDFFHKCNRQRHYVLDKINQGPFSSHQRDREKGGERIGKGGEGIVMMNYNTEDVPVGSGYANCSQQ